MRESATGLCHTPDQCFHKRTITKSPSPRDLPLPSGLAFLVTWHTVGALRDALRRGKPTPPCSQQAYLSLAAYQTIQPDPLLRRQPPRPFRSGRASHDLRNASGASQTKVSGRYLADSRESVATPHRRVSKTCPRYSNFCPLLAWPPCQVLEISHFPPGMSFARATMRSQ